MKRRLTFLLLICLAVSSTSVLAQSQADDETAMLTLDECLRLALQNNLQLVSAKYNPQVAGEDVEVRKADFDVNFEAGLNQQQFQQPPLQASTVTTQDTTTFDVGKVRQNLKFGADYEVGFQSFFTTFDAPNAVSSELWRSSFNFIFNMPILKGFGQEVSTEALVLARNNQEISRHDLERDAELVAEQVEGAYWNVVAAREALRIERLSLGRAEDLLELNRKKVEVGTLAPIEITQARAGVASQEEGVIVAQQTLEDAEDELLRLLAVPRGDPMWNQSILNGTRPTFQKREIDLESTIDEALEARSELASARQELINRELNERVARRQVRHQLDFSASYVPRGTSQDLPALSSPSDPNVTLPPEDAQLGTSIDRVFSTDEFTWNAALVYRVPVGNRAARAGYARARLTREKSEVDVQDIEQTVRVEVRRAVRAVESGIKRVEAAQINVELQREKLDAEQKKFENGMSTSFEVLTFQNDLADAELGEIRARLDYIKAVAALERSKGTMLESRGLTLASNP